MNSIGFLEGLREKEAEMEADLAAIRRLIAREVAATNGHSSIKAPHLNTPESTPQSGPPPQRHVFTPHADSTATRILAEARRALETAPGRSLPFLTVCERLSKDLAGTSKQRQYIRLTLQRSGSRVGIEYVDANNVRLT